jgi:hypothetical protein
MKTWRIVLDYDWSREQTGLIGNESRVLDMLEAGRNYPGQKPSCPDNPGAFNWKAHP